MWLKVSLSLSLKGPIVYSGYFSVNPVSFCVYLAIPNLNNQKFYCLSIFRIACPLPVFTL